MAGDEIPAEILARLTEALKSLGIADVAITGGVALGVWSTPRATRDIDLCGVVPPEAVDKLLLTRDGIRSGPEVLPDVIRFRFGEWDVDLFVAKSEFDKSCLQRSAEAELGGARVRVVSAEDLVVHKFVKLRTDRRRALQDLSDLRTLVRDRPALDRAYIERWLLSDERAILDALATEDDERLLRRLLAK